MYKKCDNTLLYFNEYILIWNKLAVLLYQIWIVWGKEKCKKNREYFF